MSKDADIMTELNSVRNQIMAARRVLNSLVTIKVNRMLYFGKEMYREECGHEMTYRSLACFLAPLAYGDSDCPYFIQEWDSDCIDVIWRVLPNDEVNDFIDMETSKLTPVVVTTKFEIHYYKIFECLRRGEDRILEKLLPHDMLQEWLNEKEEDSEQKG